MPDLERLTDRLQIDLAIKTQDPEKIGFARGYVAGKDSARIEILVVAMIVILLLVIFL